MPKILNLSVAVRPLILRTVIPFALAAGIANPVQAQVAAPLSLHSLIVEQAKDDMLVFYTHHDGQLWVKGGQVDPAAQSLLQLVETSEYDGLDPASLGAGELRAALDRATAQATPENLASAELQASRTLSNYVAATLRSDPNAMVYEHDVLRPIETNSHTVLNAAAEAPSLADYVGHMQWMHPMYGDLRRKIMEQPDAIAMRQAAIASLQRVRALPSTNWSRQIVIDAASARLFMYEGGHVVDTMKVVVGKTETQTPLMAGFVRYAVLNPYWNVPPELVKKTISKNVLSMGLSYLRNRGYEVISEYGESAQLIDPSTVDWKAVHAGTATVKVRQKPSSYNAMGDVKFEFPNPMGIYLHDTPDLQLMREPTRQFSNGCVRLEDAHRFGQWLFQGAMPSAAGTAPEQRVDLAEPVPIYITYLTIQDNGGSLAVGPDPYARDSMDTPALARLQ